MKVLVLGGKGFIGRYVVRALIERGCEAVVGTRRVNPSKRVTTELSLILHKRTHENDWHEVIAPFDVVVNCVGILRERWGESYADVYQNAPVAIASACAAQKTRFIHVTALGLHSNATSGFLREKRAGEAAIAQVGGDTCIVRPSLLDGADGFGSRWLRRVAQWPVHFVPADATGVLAPLDVGELGEAIAALCECRTDQLPASVELGGDTRYKLSEYLNVLRDKPNAALTLAVPAWIVRLLAHGLDLVHATPLSWGHVEHMRRDNAPRVADAHALRQWIRRAPAAVGHNKGRQNIVGRALPVA